MENKKTKIISIASIIALALTLLTATFAYFMAQTGEGKSTDIKINANTVDTFTFETGSAISLNLNQDNFASGKGNQTGTTFAKAMLTANNKTNTATEHYYMYLNISLNTFTYTQDENTPEILLTITDASGNAITNISDLTYKTVTDGKGASISGFDITTKSGLVTLFDNREITTTSTKTEQWNVTVTFVNYDADQSKNAGKSFDSKILIQKEKINANIADVCSNGENLTNCLTTLGTEGTLSYTNLYHHDTSLDNGAGDNSYRYAGGDYVLTDIGKATGATMMIGYNEKVTTALIDFYCDGTKQFVGSALCSMSKPHYYLIKGDTTQYQTYNEALSASVEKGYLTKNNIKNFVCFGSNTTPCPTENLYRIIGVIDGKVKLIKWSYATSSLLGTDGDYRNRSGTSISYSYVSGLQVENSLNENGYFWNNATQSNVWSESNLNKINLNTNFINNVGTTWANKIATTTWKVGVSPYTFEVVYSLVPKTLYQYEVGRNALSTTYNAKVGLMYISDYYYGANPLAWTLVGYNSDYSKSYASAKGENWLYMGGYEWTISASGDTTDGYSVFLVSAGFLTGMYVNWEFFVRPVFNLESSVTYVSGNGTQSDPIRIN